MSRISVDVSSARIPVLQVGYQGENEVTDVLFDISSWITEFGEGVAQLRVKRPGNSEEESYVLSLTITDGKAVWTVSETDTANKGNGKVQLSYMVGNIVKKAVIYPYKVGKSIVGADSPADPFDSWIERSKAWAIGETLAGDNVPETDETYQNNAKYYAEQADILGSAQVVLAAEKVTLAAEQVTLATEKADAAAASEAAVNGVSTQLTTRMSAIETEQAVQDARMDTFTSLPEGSTSGNAELADIRVGADGTTYDTAGNAVRGQIGELKSDFNSVIYKSFSKNLYDESKAVSGYLNLDGTIHADNGSGWQTSDFIDCVENKTFTCSFESPTSKRESCSAFFLTEYDSNKNVIKQTNTAISPFTVSSDAYFFRLCKQTTYDSKYQIEIGSSYTDYVPYSYIIYVDKIKNGIVGYKKLDESLTELFTPSKFINQELDYSIGGYVDKRGIVSAFDNCYVTDYIDCTDINAIKYYGKSYYDGVCLLIFDDSKNVMSYYPANTSGINLFDDVVIIPKNAKYVRIADYSGATATNVMVEFSKSIELSTNKKWNDKKWVCIGDSLTEVNSRTTKHYHDYISEETGISVVNMGVSGSGYAKGSDTSQAFYQRATNTPTDADVITIFGSFNDMSSELEVGTYLDGDTTTLAGCINATIDAIQSRIPLANIGIVSPTPWVSTQPNETGRAYEYVAVMKRICEHRSIPFLDLWRCSNLRPWDADFRPIAYSKDDGNGVHPDETGHKIIAPRFKAFLETLIM